MEEYVVTSNDSFNPDVFAAVYAYTEFIQKCEKRAVPHFTKIDNETKNICSLFNIDVKQDKAIKNFSDVILIQNSNFDNLSKEILKENVTEIITNNKNIELSNEFLNANITQKDVVALSTIVLNRFIDYSVILSDNSAILLYHGIDYAIKNSKENISSTEDVKALEWLNINYNKKIKK